jgi:hypothetical protein
MGAISIGQGRYYDGYQPQRDGVDEGKYDQAGKIGSPSRTGNFEGSREQ